MATSGIDVDNKLQLWMDIKLFESDNSATGLDLRHHMSSCHRILHCLCYQLLAEFQFIDGNRFIRYRDIK